MRPYKLVASAVAIGLATAGATALAGEQTDPNIIAEGKSIAFDRKKGNCLSCHMIEDGELPGNSGPPLIARQQRYPDKAKLREQIWDATVRNAQSMMPPFGKHGILTEDELDKVVEYIYSL